MIAAGGGRSAPAPSELTPRTFLVRVLNLLTNDVVAWLPSFALRRLWYTRVLGARIGPGAGVFRGCHVWFYGRRQVRNGGLVIGARTRVNARCCLDTRGTLVIGDDVSISREVMILTATHEMDDPSFLLVEHPVRIEDRVWIGARAIVLPGVTLGAGCVVAAGAVVSRDVDPLAVVGGVPARTIGTRLPEGLGYTLDGPLPLFE